MGSKTAKRVRQWLHGINDRPERFDDRCEGFSDGERGSMGIDNGERVW
jgi:hypothetical protein